VWQCSQHLQHCCRHTATHVLTQGTGSTVRVVSAAVSCEPMIQVLVQLPSGRQQDHSSKETEAEGRRGHGTAGGGSQGPGALEEGSRCQHQTAGANRLLVPTGEGGRLLVMSKAMVQHDIESGRLGSTAGRLV
jgi:hypothetical protein